MTISNVTTSSTQYNGDDSTTAFATAYVFDVEGSLDVYLDTVLQTLTTHYTVSGGGTVPATGTVTMVTPPATGEVLTIQRVTPRTQAKDYVENESFPAASHEGGLDKLTLLIQEVEEALGRTVLQDVTTTITGLTLPAPVAEEYLRWNAAGTDLENIAAAAAGIANIVEDITPQLGGNLDVNSSSIVSASAGDIAITPDTTGDIILDGLKWPQADGSASQVIKTDGAGQLAFTTIAAAGNTWEFIGSSSVSASTAEVTFTGLSGYDEYQIFIIDLNNETANARVRLQYAITGTSYIIDGYDYATVTTTLLSATGAAYLPIGGENITGGHHAIIHILDGTAASFPCVRAVCASFKTQPDGDGFTTNLLHGGSYSASTDRRGSITAIKILAADSDTWDAGTITILGRNFATS